MVWNNSCYKCKWYLYSRSCLAFPKKIPDDIWTGKNKHEEKEKGDHGFIFFDYKKDKQTKKVSK